MKLKKVVAVTLALTMCVGTLVACSKSEDKKDDKKETTKETTIDISGIKFVNEGKLSMGAEIGYPPFVLLPPPATAMTMWAERDLTRFMLMFLARKALLCATPLLTAQAP